MNTRSTGESSRQVQLIFQEAPAGQVKEALGDKLADGTQPRPLASSEDQSLHRLNTTSVILGVQVGLPELSVLLIHAAQT